MASDPCARGTRITRAGLAQPDRQRAELSRSHFRPDDRDLADLVLFGQRFARHLKFYNTTNAVEGDWEVFFSSDVTAALAALAKLPLETLARFQSDLQGWLLADPNRPADMLGSQFRLWFHLPLAVLQSAGLALDRMPQDHPLALSAPVFARRALAQPLSDLAGWFKGALPGEAGLFADTRIEATDLNLTGAAGDLRPQVPSSLSALLMGREAFANLSIGHSLSGGLTGAGWPAHLAAAPIDAAPYADAATPQGRVEDALSYNLLSHAVERLRDACARLQADARAALANSLNGLGGHAPQSGLWLAFLDLFTTAQAEMNDFTGRHLDFYLRDVLRLRALGPVSDHVHLTFQLARGTSALHLPAGTAFGAGKDSAGRPVTFTLDNDLVVNRARVARLAGLRRHRVQTVAGPEAWVEAAPDVLALDGLGGQPLPAGAGFAPFGPDPSPFARLGFVVADRRLFLREGQRHITLRAEVPSALPQGLHPDLKVRLSGADGWHEVVPGFAVVLEDVPDIRPPKQHRPLDYLHGRPQKSLIAGQISPALLALGTGRKTQPLAALDGWSALGGPRRGDLIWQRPPTKAPKRQVRNLRLVVDLPPDAPAIVPLDPALHGTDHAPGLPVMEVIFGFATAEGRRAFAVLQDLVTTRPTLEVEASGLRQLSVQAAGAAADPSKPFAPFGPRPRTGDALILGSTEIFSKPLAEWSLKVDWLTPYTSTGFYRNTGATGITAQLAILQGGDWSPVDGQTPHLPMGSGGIISLGGAAQVDGDPPQGLENPAFDATAQTGFLRLRLQSDFGHADYPEALTRATVDLARGVAHRKAGGVNYTPAVSETAFLGLMPKQPYDPVLTRIEARYVTTRDPVQMLRHLWPFGTDLAQENDLQNESRLLPLLPEEAAFFVGLQDFEGPARITLLAEVENGTGDPLLPRPEFTFSRLGPEGFVPLPSQDIDDKSGGLTASGVIGLALPGPDERPPSPQMPPGLTWLKLSVDDHAAAVNRLRALVAQAGRSTFQDQQNDPARLALPLPAGSIARLQTPEPRLKLVVQPFAGFGGSPPEASSAMDIRVSERLRHKDRGITMWDIEALVAQEFPQIYRVKCLNLTALQRNAAGVVTADNENQPGAVTVVAVPYVRPGDPGNPLRPYLDQATLAAIDRFLRPRLSPFVRLEVVNPRIEEVHLEFRVRFAPGIADTAFYRVGLGQALATHLTPWAGPGGGAVSFGGQLWKSTVIDFLDSQPYVDFVTDVRMYHKPDVSLADGQWTPVDRDLIETSSARSVLVSAASHTITELPGETP